MNNKTLQQAPYLRNQRQFPNDNPKELANQVDHAYVDLAGKVNQRIIGNYAVNTQAITGERWFFSNTPQQSLRQVYPFTATGSIPHNINWFNSVAAISVRTYGSFTDLTNWYGCIYGSNVAIAGQVSFYITTEYIVIIAGAGAPSITYGFIDLEYISQI